MKENIFSWQEGVWKQLVARREALPHAILLRGRSGVGKTVLARAFAQALLCERRQPNGMACGQCEACGWFELGNHPDFRQVEPDALSLINTEAGEGGERTKEPSKQIRIEQVRALQDFLAVGSHRGGLRVTIIRPAEAMNVATANALLKSLEEPPAGVLFLLVSSQPTRLLPTIRSRCQAIDVPSPTPEAATAWLRAQGAAEPDVLLAHASHAPLAALESIEQMAVRNQLLQRLARGESDPLALADACANVASVELVSWLQKWVYDLAAVKLSVAPRYHPAAIEALRKLCPRIDLHRLLRFQRHLNAARATAQHPLNARLFVEELFMQYQALKEGSRG